MVKVIETDATPAEQMLDWESIKRKHEQAMLDDPVWSVFGGTVYVNGRRYQVVESEPVRT